jgi:hypothetical protein
MSVTSGKRRHPGVLGPDRGRVTTVTLQLANQVRRLGRDNLTVQQIAKRLALPEAAILETLSMLGLPLPGETFEPNSAPISQAVSGHIGASRSRFGHNRS